MTNQEIYETVVRHLHQQGRPAIAQSVNGETCAYRGAEGRMCAVGCLIKDEFYIDRMEGASIHNDLVMDVVNLSFGYHLSQNQQNLLASLQDVHDGWTSARDDADDREYKWSHISKALLSVTLTYNITWPDDIPKE